MRSESPDQQDSHLCQLSGFLIYQALSLGVGLMTVNFSDQPMEERLVRKGASKRELEYDDGMKQKVGHQKGTQS